MNVLAESGQIVNELPMPPLGYGLLAVGTFAALLAVTFAFKNVAHRQGPPRRPSAGGH